MKYGLNSVDRNALLWWHKSLDNNRGDRARLRRSERAEDVLLTSAFYQFLQAMPDNWQEEKDMFASAVIVGLLSHVKENRLIESRGYQPKDKSKPKNIATFAELLARPAQGKKTPPVSELRFNDLMKSRTTDEFYRRMIRVIRLLDGRINIASMADDVFLWHQEFKQHIDRDPSNRLAIRWGTAYFTALPPKESTKGD